MRALLARSARSLCARPPTNTALRCFSRTSPSFKKRKNAPSQVAFSDGFDNSFVEDTELFSSKSDPEVSSAVNSSSTSTAPASKERVADKLFDEQYTFAVDRLSPNPRVKHPLVRANAIRRLLHYSNSAEHLHRIGELLVLWRNAGRLVDDDTALEIIDRCLAWKPALLVQLFADRPRYGLTIPSLRDARRILRRLVLARPPAIAESSNFTLRAAANAQALRDATRFAALLPVHGLPPATADPTCCALLAQACARNLNLASRIGANNSPETEKEGEGVQHQGAELTEESSRGLVAITAELWRALKADADKPAEHASDPRVGKGDHAPSVASKRESGFTQSLLTESKWISDALGDVVRALKAADSKSADRFSSLLARRIGSV